MGKKLDQLHFINIKSKFPFINAWCQCDWLLNKCVVMLYHSLHLCLSVSLFHFHSPNKCIRPTSELDFAAVLLCLVLGCERVFLWWWFPQRSHFHFMREGFLVPNLHVCERNECEFMHIFCVSICEHTHTHTSRHTWIASGFAATSPLGNKLSLNLDLLTLLRAKNGFYIVRYRCRMRIYGSAMCSTLDTYQIFSKKNFISIVYLVHAE